MSKAINVRVSRAIGKDEELGEYVRRVANAVHENFSTFGAAEKYDVYV